MRITITKQLAMYMTAGSAIYSTGGGIEENTQNSMFDKLIAKKTPLTLISLDELNDKDYVCTAYAVGSAGDTSSDLSSLLKLGLSALENHLGKSFKAVFPGETNADILAFQAASALGLSVLDADSTGGRAVPEIVQDNFTIINRPVTPLVAVDKTGKVSVLKAAVSPDNIESFVRGLSAQSDGLIAVLDHPVTVKEAKKILTVGVLSRSLTIGEIRYKNNGKKRIDKMLAEISGEVLCRGKVINVNLQHNKEKGFLEGSYIISQGISEFEVIVKNENLFCLSNHMLLTSSPDSLLLIEKSSGKGIHNSNVTAGLDVILIKKNATPLWNSEKGKAIFSPEHFGLSFLTD